MKTNRPFKFRVMQRDFHKSIDSKYEGACVEVAVKPRGVAVRDSKNRTGGTLFFTKKEWKAFLGGVSKGQFNI